LSILEHTTDSVPIISSERMSSYRNDPYLSLQSDLRLSYALEQQKS